MAGDYFENERKWSRFLSTLRNESSARASTKIEMKNDKIKCLAYTFADKLLPNSTAKVTVTAEKASMQQIKDRRDISSTPRPALFKAMSEPTHKRKSLVTDSTNEQSLDSTHERPKQKKSGKGAMSKPPPIPSYLSADLATETPIAIELEEGENINLVDDSDSKMSSLCNLADDEIIAGFKSRDRLTTELQQASSTRKSTPLANSLQAPGSIVFDLTRPTSEESEKNSDISPLKRKKAGSLDRDKLKFVDKAQTFPRIQEPSSDEFKKTEPVKRETSASTEITKPMLCAVVQEKNRGKLYDLDLNLIPESKPVTYDLTLSDTGEDENESQMPKETKKRKKKDIIGRETPSNDSGNFVESKSVPMSATERYTAVEHETSTSDQSLVPLVKPDHQDQDSHLISEISPQSVPSVQGKIQLQRQRERISMSPQKRKSDIDIPCSKWDISIFARYFDFDSTVTDLDILEEREVMPQLEECRNIVHRELHKRLELMYGKNELESTSFLFREIRTNETTVRLLLDSIFLPLCSELGLRIEVKKRMECSYLVPCEFDYRILHDQNVIGCVEAKSANGFSKNSVFQAVLQLTILQAEAFQKGQVETTQPFFNVLTDGLRWIFIQLEGEKLKFEHTCVRQLNINKMEKIEDFHVFIPKLIGFLSLSMNKKSYDYEEGDEEGDEEMDKEEEEEEDDFIDLT